MYFMLAKTELVFMIVNREGSPAQEVQKRHAAGQGSSRNEGFSYIPRRVPVLHVFIMDAHRQKQRVRAATLSASLFMLVGLFACHFAF